MSFGLNEGFRDFKDLIIKDAGKEINNLRDGTTQKSIKDQVRKKMDFHPVLTDLNRTPNSRFDDEMLAQRLVAKYKDPVKIKAAIDSILENDGRFNNKNTERKTNTDTFSVDKTRLQAIKQHIDEIAKSKETNQTANTSKTPPMQRIKDKAAALLAPKDAAGRTTEAKMPGAKWLQTQDKEAKEQKEMAKLQANIAADLVGLVFRKPTEATAFKDTNGNEHFLKQTHGHMDEKGTFVAGHAISAELANKDAKVLELANQAVITFHDKNSPDQAFEVVLGRSGRSDRGSKVDDKSMLDITERLKSSSKNGLKEVRDSQNHIYYEYQRADITMMDTNRIKSAGTTLLSGIKRGKNFVQKKPLTPIESERQFVHAKRKAVRDKWADGAMDAQRGRRYLERNVNINGREHKVREYEPLVWNFVFSSSAKTASNVTTARKDNIPNALYLFSQYQKQEAAIGTLFASIDTTTKNGRQELAEALKKELTNEKSTLDDNQKLALQAMLVTLTGKDSRGANYDHKYGSDVQFLLLNHLADMTGTAITVECKSGNDRTATAMALRCALKEFEKTTGKSYDPTDLRTHNQDQFSPFFNKYAKEFGAPNVRASRGFDKEGKAILKTRTSPAFTKYTNESDMSETFHLK